jgi:hypothetical protein
LASAEPCHCQTTTPDRVADDVEQAMCARRGVFGLRSAPNRGEFGANGRCVLNRKRIDY